MKSIILCLLLIAGWTSVASAQVTYDASTGAYCDSLGACSAGATFPFPATVVMTYPHTTGAGSNRAIGIFVFVGCGGTDVSPSVSSITYAGVSLSNSGLPNVTAGSGPPRRGQIWSLAAGTQPTTGTNNVVITISTALTTACTGVARLMSGVVTAAGVDQTTTFTASNGSSGSGTTASTTLSSSGANDLVIHSGCSGDNTSAPTGTSRWSNNDTATSCNSNVGATATGGTTSLQFTVASSDSWLEMAASFKAASGGGGDTPTTAVRSLLGIGR